MRPITEENKNVPCTPDRLANGRIEGLDAILCNWLVHYGCAVEVNYLIPKWIQIVLGIAIYN